MMMLFGAVLCILSGSCIGKMVYDFTNCSNRVLAAISGATTCVLFMIFKKLL